MTGDRLTRVTDVADVDRVGAPADALRMPAADGPQSAYRCAWTAAVNLSEKESRGA